MIERLSCDEWNSIPNKNDEVNVVLKNHDIVYKINNLWCACETTNNCNNILIFSDVYDIGNVKAMLLFIYILGKYENINCITINSSIGRYDFFKRKFAEHGAFPNPKDNRDKFYFLLSEKALDDLYDCIKDYKF